MFFIGMLQITTYENDSIYTWHVPKPKKLG